MACAPKCSASDSNPIMTYNIVYGFPDIGTKRFPGLPDSSIRNFPALQGKPTLGHPCFVKMRAYGEERVDMFGTFLDNNLFHIFAYRQRKRDASEPRNEWMAMPGNQVWVFDGHVRKNIDIFTV
jgi:hypothetical protein